MKIERYFLLFILVLPALILRDFTPNNELKYLSIADEAIRNGDWFTFYNHGTIYADKPPLYFWIIMLCKIVWGSHSMFLLSLFSVIPAFITIGIMDRWIRECSLSSRRSVALLLFTSGLFLGSALVLRMDMMMCMFITLSLYIFYKRYTEQDRKPDHFWLPFCIFMALFSKGPIGIIVPVCSIAVFLILKKEIRKFGKFLGWKEFTILLTLCVIWFGCVLWEGGYDYLYDLLFHQTINRAVDSFQHKEPFWYYGTTVWYALAPWSLFYILILVIGIWKRLITTDKEKLFFSVIATTFILLSLFSSKLDIYLLPIYPFVAYLSILLLPKIKEKWIRFTLYIPIVVFILAFPISFFLADRIEFIRLYCIRTGIGILFVSALFAFVSLRRHNLHQAIQTTALGLLFSIFVSSFALPKLNPNLGFSALSQKALEIIDNSTIENLYFYRFRSGENMDVYLHRPLFKIKEKEEMLRLYEKGGNLIFIKVWDVQKSPELRAWLSRTRYTVIGKFYIIEKPN